MVLFFVANTAIGQIAAWDFFGESSPATSTADVYSANLDASNVLTRGAGAPASVATNSFRTQGFMNDGISTANTDYFQCTVSAGTGFTLSLSTIDARFAGTATFAASPGVSSQFAYSLDGTNFTLIGSPAVTIGTPATLPQIDLTSIPALQNISDAVTVTFRYYASGQTTTGGWGYNSPAAGQYGLEIGGTLTPTGTPDIVLSSPNPAVPAANIARGSINNPIYRFDLSVTTAPAELNGVTITTAGTYVAADISNFKCWYSADNVFDAGSDVLLSTKSTTLDPGSQVFPSFVNQTIGIGATAFIFITADITCAAGLGNTINVNAISTADISFVSGNESGSAFAGDAQTIVAGSPIDVTNLAATNDNMQSSVSWTNPAGCFDEVMIVAATATNTGAPTGDGSAYTADPIFGNGTLLGNGYVVYKGSVSPQTVTGLTNGTTYFIKVFTRMGTTWSAGTEVTAIPAAPSNPTDFFRSKATGNWDVVTTWESSPDNIAWQDATLVPDMNAATITIRNGHNVTVATIVTADELIIDAGGTLTWNADFVLNNGTGTDLVVNGTVVNSAGTISFLAGAAAIYNANSLYQHARNGTSIPTATWNVSSTVEVTGSTGTFPGGMGQLFGNFTWNSPGMTASLNLVGSMTAISGNFTVAHTSTTAGRVLRLFSSQVNATFTIGGDFIINNADARLEFSNGTSTNSVLNIGGNFSVTAGSFSANVSGVLNTNFTGVNKTFQTGGTITNTQLNWQVSPGASLTLLNNMALAAGRTLTINGSFESVFNQVTGAGATVFINGYAGVQLLGGLSAMFANTGGIIIGPSSTIEYKGNGLQAITSRLDYANVTINGTGSKIASGNSFINGTLTFVNTVISTNIVAVITLTANANFVGASNASHIDGPAGRQTNSTAVYSFPVGDAGIYKPIDLIPASTNLAVFGAEYHVGAPSAAPLCDPVRMQAYTNNEWWDVQRPFGTGDFSVRLNYSQATSAGNWFNGVTPMPDPDNSKAITVAHLTGGCWDDLSNPSGILLGGAASGQVTSSVSSTFGPYTFGYGPLSIILPVNFGLVKAFEVGNSIKVEWNNLTETNVIDYRVEHSANGRDFTAIASIPASKNDGGRADYQFIHTTPVNGMNYYRIRSTEMNGVNKQSIIVKVDTRAGNTDLYVYPNPVLNNQFSLQLTDLPKGDYTVHVFAASGQKLYNGTIAHNGGSVTEMIQLPGTIKSGLYTVVVSGGEVDLRRKLIVQ
jgi:hypothetical protein